MRFIPLSRGKYTIIDDADFEVVNQFKWSYDHHERCDGYAIRVIKSAGQPQRSLYLHRFLLGARPGQVVDHINYNGLDNRRSNIRLCMQAQNIHHSRMRSTNTSGYRGVYWNKKSKKWLAQIRVGPGKKRRFLGLFTDAVEAAKAYDAVAREEHGEFAMLNFPATQYK